MPELNKSVYLKPFLSTLDIFQKVKHQSAKVYICLTDIKVKNLKALTKTMTFLAQFSGLMMNFNYKFLTFSLKLIHVKKKRTIIPIC